MDQSVLSGWRRAARGVREGERAWLVPFLTLIVLLFLGDFAAAPGRSLLSVYAEAELGRPPYFTSALISLQTLFGAAAAFVGGGLADTLGQKRVLVLGATGLPLVGLAFVLHSPLALVLLWVYIGFSIGLYTVGRQSYMMAAVPRQHLGLGTALIFVGMTLGGALGNSMAAPIVDRHGFAVLGAVIGGIALVVFLAGLLAMPDMRYNERRAASGPSFAGYGGVLRRPGVLAIAVVRFLPTAYWGTASLLYPLLIYRAAHVPSAAAYYGTASLLFASACQILVGRVCDRCGRKRMVAGLTAGIAAIGVATAVFSDSLVGLYVCGILGAGIAWSLSTTIPGLVSDVAPREEHGRALGLMHIAWSAGYLVGTQTGGWLVDVASGLPFLLMGLLNLVAVGAALRLAPRLERARACEPAEAERT